MIVDVEVDIVAPLLPPRGAYEKLPVAKTPKISLKHKWILFLTYRKSLIALEDVLERYFEVLQEQFFYNFLLLAAREVLTVVAAHFAAICLFRVRIMLSVWTFTLAAFLGQNLLHSL